MGCQRDLYVGYDEPSTTSDVQSAGELASSSSPDSVEPLANPALDAAVPAVATGTSMTAMATMPPPVTTTPAAEPATATQDKTEPATPSCEADRADCDGDSANGCEVDLLNDRAHCGSCTSACQSEDCMCLDGALAVSCAGTQADCDGDAANGCETDLTLSMEHCGACGSLCHSNGHDAVEAACVDGRCEITCEPRIAPEADCDNDPDNGCETYLYFDRANCGECGKTCRTNCEGGVCML